MTLDEIYNELSKPGPHSDNVIEHLPTLTSLASQCDHVTELGFKFGTSFSAVLKGKPKRAISYGENIPIIALKVWEQADIPNKHTVSILETSNLPNIDIEETDLLLLDNFNSYKRLKKVLELNGDKARKYILIHNTVCYGRVGDDAYTPGLMQAILDFISTRNNWQEYFHHTNNNGLYCLRRV